MKMELVDMIRPQSGCELAEDLQFSVFKHIYDTSNGDPCDGCAHKQGCAFLTSQAHNESSRRRENFGKVGFETNAKIAERLGISKRQVAKMRKKGEL
jgi:hypothetical protein